MTAERRLHRQTLKRSSSVITEANDPPTRYQKRFPSRPHVFPAESSALLVSVKRSSFLELASMNLLEGANVHSGAAQAEGGEERFHDDRRSGDDEAADDRELAGVGIAAPDGETAADNRDGSENEADEHDNAHGFAGPFGQAASGGLCEDAREVGCEK